MGKFIDVDAKEKRSKVFQKSANKKTRTNFVKKPTRTDITKNITDLKSNLNLLNPYIKDTIKSTPQLSGKFTKAQTESKEMQKWSQLMKAKSELTETNAKFEAPPREKMDNWDDKTYNEREEMQSALGMGNFQNRNPIQDLYSGKQGLKFDKSYKIKKEDKSRNDYAKDALAQQKTLLASANQRESWVKNNVTKKDFLDLEGYIPPKEIADIMALPMSELRRQYPELMKFKDKEYRDTKTASAFIGAAVKQFDRDLIDLFGKKEIEKMEVNQSVEFSNMLNTFVESSSLGVIKLEDLAPVGKDVYIKNDKIYYRGFEIDDKYLTEAGRNAENAVEMAISFVGAAPTYAAGSALIKKGVSLAANSQKYVETAKFFSKIDSLAKSNNLWKSALAEATAFNVMEESGEALIRKTTGQEYTFSNFVNGLIMGAAVGGVLQIGGAAIKAKKVEQQIQDANKIYISTKDLESLKGMPLGNSTFGEIFGEAQFAYLDKFRKQGRPGIERSAPLPEVSSEMKPLYDEAKKYNSAEEFVKAQGDPVYHGSRTKRKDFTDFDMSNVGQGVGTDKEGIFFTNSKDLASRYTFDAKTGKTGNVIESYIDTKKPLVIKTEKRPLNYFNENKDRLFKDVKKGGYDGIIVKDKISDENIIVALNPSQIKTKSQLTNIWKEANQPKQSITPTPNKMLQRERGGLNNQPEKSPAELYGKSKVGKSIEAKAIEAKLTKVFEDTAEYDKIKIADQADKATKLVSEDLELAQAIMRGERELPTNLRGVALVSALEDFAIATKDVKLLHDLATSKIVSDTSIHAQEMRLMAERAPESPVMAMQRIAKEREDAAFKQLARQLEQEANAHYRKIQKQIEKEEAMRQKQIGKGAKEMGRSIDRMFKDADKELVGIQRREDKELMGDIKAETKEVRKAVLKEVKIRSISDMKNVLKDQIKRTIRAERPKVDDWDDFVNSITC